MAQDSTYDTIRKSKTCPGCNGVLKAGRIAHTVERCAYDFQPTFWPKTPAGWKRKPGGAVGFCRDGGHVIKLGKDRWKWLAGPTNGPGSSGYEATLEAAVAAAERYL